MVVLVFTVKAGSDLSLFEIYFVSSYIKYFACISMSHAVLQLWPLVLQTVELRQRLSKAHAKNSGFGFAAGPYCSNPPVLGYSCTSLSLCVRQYCTLPLSLL